MEGLSFLVTSTAKNCPWARQCIRSVEAQHYPSFRHIYVAADEITYHVAKSVARDPRTVVCYSEQGTIENVWSVWKEQDPKTVIVWLDGDDWLSGPGVLNKLEEVYREKDPWLTYGSFRWLRYPGFDTPLFGTRYPPAPNSDGPRLGRWRASHLKTFRAGLVQQIEEKHLRRADGSWVHYCTDLLFMLPMLEMAGERYEAIPDILSMYNYSASTFMGGREPGATPQGEVDELRGIRALPPYRELTVRPW